MSKFPNKKPTALLMDSLVNGMRHQLVRAALLESNLKHGFLKSIKIIDIDIPNDIVQCIVMRNLIHLLLIVMNGKPELRLKYWRTLRAPDSNMFQ